MTMNKSFELNIKKCKQGIDGINFEYNIQLGDYFSSEIPPSKQFLNECGKKIAEITCNTKPISNYDNKDNAYLEIVQGIKKAIEHF